MEKMYASSIYNRIKQGSWRDAFPPFGPKIGFGQKLEKIEDSWADKWVAIDNYNNIAKTLGQSIGKPNENEKVKPIAIEDMHSFLDKMEDWVATYGNILTFPASSQGWKKAIEKTIMDGDIDQTLIMIAAFPEQFKETVLNLSLPENRAGKWLKTCIVKEEKKELAPAEQKSELESINLPNLSITAEKIAASDTVASEKEESSKEINTNTPPVRKPYFNAGEKATLAWLNETLSELSYNEKDKAVNKEIMDKKIKDWVNREESKTTMDSFFEDEFYGALVNLKIDQLKSLQRFWPNNKKLPIADSLALLSSTKFWGLIKHPEPQERDFIFSNILPTIISIENLKFSEKYQIGKEMLKPAVKNADLFRQRLNLWTGIGGVPTDKKPKSIKYEEDVFNSINNASEEEVSIMSWIIKKENPMWIKELKNFADERGLVLESLDKAYNTIKDTERYKPKGLS